MSGKPFWPCGCPKATEVDHIGDRGRHDELRARDEAAKAVVKAFGSLRANEALMRSVLLPPWLVEVLEALARTYEDER